MTKIIYLSHWRFPSEKTMSPLIIKTCAHFVSLGYQVELWAPDRRNPKTGDPFTYHGVETRFPIRIVPTIDLMHFHFLKQFSFLLMVATFNISSFFMLLKKRRSERDLILYGHDVRDFVFSSKLSIPLFIEIHDFYESSLSYINRSVLKNTSGLIVTNTLKVKKIEKQYGFPMDRMIHQPNAVDAELFDIATDKVSARRELGITETYRIALYTGHLFAWKGVYTFADASQFLSDDVHIYFVGGTDEDRKALQHYATEKGYARIHFLEHQRHEKIPLYLKAADVLVLPNTAKDHASKYETSPVKLFEYLASGVPVVASDIPAIREIVSEREVAFFSPDDPEDLAHVIQTVMKSPDEYKIKNAKKLAYSCSWEKRAKHISDLIDQCT